MTFDNLENVGQYRIMYLLFFSIGGVLLAYSTLNAGGIRQHYILFALSVVFLVLYAFSLLVQLGYFYFSDEGKKIVIRYYWAHPLLSKYRAIEFPKSTLISYKMRTRFLGQKKELLISVQRGKGTVQFPPLSMSGVTVENRMKMLVSLTRIIKE